MYSFFSPLIDSSFTTGGTWSGITAKTDSLCVSAISIWASVKDKTTSLQATTKNFYYIFQFSISNIVLISFKIFKPGFAGLE